MRKNLLLVVLACCLPALGSSDRIFTSPVQYTRAESWPNYQPGNYSVGHGGGGYNVVCFVTAHASNIAKTGSPEVTLTIKEEKLSTSYRMDNATGNFPDSTVSSGGAMRFFARTTNPSERSITHTVDAGKTMGFGFFYTCPFNYVSSACATTIPTSGTMSGQISSPTSSNFQVFATADYQFQIEAKVAGTEGAIVSGGFSYCTIGPMANVVKETAKFSLNRGNAF